MNKLFIGLLFGLALFFGACGSSSSNDATTDPCTDDPSLAECQLDNDEDVEPGEGETEP